jgi:hypothetical protein
MAVKVLHLSRPAGVEPAGKLSLALGIGRGRRGSEEVETFGLEVGAEL